VSGRAGLIVGSLLLLASIVFGGFAACTSHTSEVERTGLGHREAAQLFRMRLI
jgi:hypothetical protein